MISLSWPLKFRVGTTEIASLTVQVKDETAHNQHVLDDRPRRVVKEADASRLTTKTGRFRGPEESTSAIYLTR